MSQSLLDALSPGFLVEVVRGLLVDHLSTLRDGWAVRTEARSWSDETLLDSIGSGIDSLALLTLADDVNRRFFIHDVGIEDYLLARRRLVDWAELILEAWRRVADPRVQFGTSGSTATPKRVTHTLASLEQEASALLGVMHTFDRVVAYVPPHHIYGFLFTVALPAMAGVPVVPRYLHPIDMTVRPGDLIVSFPDHWQLMASRAADAGGVGSRATIQGVSSTAPLATATASAVRRSGVRLVEVYGSTETAGIGYRCVDDAPYELFPFWSRGDDGDAPTLRRASASSSEITSVPVMDRLRWIDDRHFEVVGRFDDVVQIGGVNVSPQAVAGRLLQNESVAACAVRPFAAGGGTRLKAFIVPSAPDDGLRVTIGRWATEHLPSSERPAVYTFGPRLPMTAIGKLADWEITASVDGDDDTRP